MNIHCEALLVYTFCLSTTKRIAARDRSLIAEGGGGASYVKFYPYKKGGGGGAEQDLICSPPPFYFK